MRPEELTNLFARISEVSTHTEEKTFFQKEIDATEEPCQRKLMFSKEQKNLLIHGDNLAAMNTLIKMGFKNSIRLIYVDPPFGTNGVFRGNRHISSSYNDKLAYVDYDLNLEFLEFLGARLKIARELLSEDGTIYVHMGLKSSHYVKIILDMIFGFENFVNDICRVKSNPKNFSRKAFSNVHDHVLVYAKNSKKQLWNEPREQYSEEELKRLFPKIEAETGRSYTTVPIHAPGETKNGKTNKEWRGMKPPEGRHWRCAPEILEECQIAGKIEWSSNGNPRMKIYADEHKEKGKRMQDVWQKFKDPMYPKYPTEKNITMLKTIIETSSNSQDIVLDFFGGSGSTALAAFELGRRWIYIDNSEHACKTAANNLRKKDCEFTSYSLD